MMQQRRKRVERNGREKGMTVPSSKYFDYTVVGGILMMGVDGWS
jgi:hypothetical protein